MSAFLRFSLQCLYHQFPLRRFWKGTQLTCFAKHSLISQSGGIVVPFCMENKSLPIYRSGHTVGRFTGDGRFAVNCSDVICELTIFNVSVTDAGEYQCIRNEGLGSNTSIILNVLGKVACVFVFSSILLFTIINKGYSFI